MLASTSFASRFVFVARFCFWLMEADCALACLQPELSQPEARDKLASRDLRELERDKQKLKTRPEKAAHPFEASLFLVGLARNHALE